MFLQRRIRSVKERLNSRSLSHVTGKHHLTSLMISACKLTAFTKLPQTSNKQHTVNVGLFFISKCSYNPYDGPNDNPEVELPLTAGEYIYVYGDMDDDGFYEGEFLFIR